MQNFSDLGHFKQKILQKSITFEPKLWFSKFKGLNRSEFHQSTNYRYKSVRFLKKYRFRYEIPKIGTSEGPTPLSPTSTSPLIVFLASSLNPNISFFLPLKSILKRTRDVRKALKKTVTYEISSQIATHPNHFENP